MPAHGWTRCGQDWQVEFPHDTLSPSLARELAGKARSRKRHILFFVHGYNNDMGDVVQHHKLWVERLKFRKRLFITINENDYALAASRAKARSRAAWPRTALRFHDEGNWYGFR